MQLEVPAWQGQLVSSGALDVEAKLYISNLDSGVSNEDIKVLFSEVGDLKRYSINYDKSGRSKGTAEVVFFRQADAFAAIKRYNNVQLDGKPMTIELVGANVVMSASVPPTKSGILRAPNMASRRVLEDSYFDTHIWLFVVKYDSWTWATGDLEKIGVGRGWVRGGVSCRFGRGRGHEHERDGPIGKKLSAEDLDADLDKYHLEATRIK
ncbi:hypothetical protein Golax_002141 [Gossypium laxum]|uniref:RRM domain-containing protein n=1 Tax=Gossypium laxum TaxID=34288 RepID=A0A7J9AQE2_9ROSI|nr:hypothetical protein [Gossypium laxum]